MNEQNEMSVVRSEGQSLAPAAREADAANVGMMLKKVIENGVTGENVAAVESLVKLFERMEDRNAQKQFAAAFAKLQSELPTIVAKSVIPNRGKYAKFEDVMLEIQPHLQRNGFSVSFSQDFKENRILEICTLRHIGGHSVENSFAVRAGGKADSETQADCKAATTAKRNALCNALNIVIRQDCLSGDDDSDASIEGGPISQQQADSLKTRVMDTGSDCARFLKFAGASKFEEIASCKYAMLDESLRKKERTT